MVWSRSVLVHQIESDLYTRSGKAISNFEVTLPKEQSDLAYELIKDPYNFDFLTLSENFKEKELESGLLEHITSFLLELGSGFAFVGKQKILKSVKKIFTLTCFSII
ncbi:MAG: PDDEXK nuclease domain-containing protein [Arcobacteraceae bacterium]|nr:PDDEXK nuclease domain-containing protein [Arcobacteraceae bacterium]